ncbi:MAG TPA: ABC transporter permease [Bryobacteraceae bacterium]|nr:ABC transporter permease [Bryobacteraceae bacterium]
MKKNSIPAILTLALGTGSVTIVFAIVYAVLIHPLPFRNTAALVTLWEEDRSPNVAVRTPGSFSDPRESMIAPGNLNAWMAARSFASSAGATFAFFDVTDIDRPTSLVAGRVTRNFFETLGVTPVLGRVFEAGEDLRSVMLSYWTWRTYYGGDRDIVGKSITLSGQRFTVVGVLPRDFLFYTREFALWVPMEFAPQQATEWRRRSFLGVARLRAGVTAAQARAELSSIAARLEQLHPETNRDRGAMVVPIEERYSEYARAPLLLLLAAVGLLLMMACANVAALLLVRGTARSKELAIRAALGASTGRLLLDSLRESLVMAFVAAVIGVVPAYWLAPAIARLIPKLLPAPIPGLEHIAVNGSVVAFTMSVAIATVLIFGVGPALKSISRASLVERAATFDRGSSRWLSGIVAGEVALATLLLAGAGLMLRTVWTLNTQNYGFVPDHVLQFRTPLGRDFKTPEQRLAFFDEALRHVQAVPGVVSAALVYSPPFGGGWGDSEFQVEGSEVHGLLLHNVTTPGYFGVMRIPLKSGRDFNGSDSGSGATVAIVSEALARRCFGEENPLGRRLTVDRRAVEVVGVAGDVANVLMSAPGLMLYTPLAQTTQGAMGYVVRTSPEPMGMASSIERAIWAFKKNQPITYVRTFGDDFEAEVWKQKLTAIGLETVAGLGLILAAVGIYGVISYALKLRIREIGVRIAVGATPGGVVGLITLAGAKMVGVGLGVGLAGAWVATRLLGSLLYGVGVHDLWSFGGVGLGLGAVGLVASYLPARRAAGVDPCEALRAEL